MSSTSGSTTSSTSSSGGGSGTTTSGTGGTGGTTTSSGSGGTGGTTTSSGSGGTGGATTSSGSGGTGGTGGSGGTSSSSSSGGGGAIDLPGLACLSCPSGFTNNGGKCSPNDNPKYGCGSGTACTIPPASHLEATCAGGLCALGACRPGFADCNGTPGCEADLSMPETCGACTNACAPGEVCTPTGCAATCPFPNTNCGGPCVNVQSDPHRCGQCFTQCPEEANGDAVCTNGACKVACRPGYTPKLGKCLDPSSDPTCCGPTCEACPYPPGGSTVCNAGSCQALCPPGTTLCGGKCAVLASDIAHCGACDTPCSPGVCMGGTCNPTATDTLATGLGPVAEILVDDVAVYYSHGVPNAAPSAVARVDKATGASTTLVSAALGHIALDDTFLYWKEANAIRRVPKLGGAAQLVVPLTAGNTPDFTVRGGKVYWIDTAAMTVFAMPSDGSGAPVPVVVDVVPVIKIAVNAAQLYWIDQNGSEWHLWRTSLDGLGMHHHMDQLGATLLAVDADNVYSVELNSTSNGSTRVLQNANANVFSIQSAGTVTALALDDTYLYALGYNVWEQITAKAQKCGKAGSYTYLSPIINPPFTVDDGFLYYVANGTLRRTPK